MIRYACPHCQRICESADVMRGFTVFCLGCRQPIRVPAESTILDAAAATSPPQALAPLPPLPPPSPPPVRAEPVVIPPKPVVIPPPVEVRRVDPAPSAPAKPLVALMPVATRPRPRVLLLALVGGLALLLVIVGGVGYRWYGQRKARQRQAAEQAELDQRKLAIHVNFAPAALKRLAAKLPAWEIAPTAQPKLKGKIVVLSRTDPADERRSFWRELGRHWPLDADEDGAALAKELFERGEVDELTFALPESRWAEGPAEADMIIGIRWQKELGGVFIDGKLVEVSEAIVSPDYAGDGPVAKRVRATVVVLDRPAGRLVARQSFFGPLPTAMPAVGKPEVAVPRPSDDVAQWLERLEAGRP